MSTTGDIKELLLPQAINAAIKAGEVIMEVYNSESNYGIEIKGDKTPIIDADRAAHNAIKEALGSTRIPIFSEEGREMMYEERRNWEMMWLVDPLDGTLEFINRTNEFTVNIALVEHGEPIAGVIYVPYLKRLYFAWRSFGAYLCRNIEPCSETPFGYHDIIGCSTKLPLTKKSRRVQKIALSRSHTNEAALNKVELIAEHCPVETIEQGSSYKFCMLAEGVADYYIRTSSTSEWDTAAGEIILSESGGSTKKLEDDSTFSYNKENPTNPWFHCRSAVSQI